MCVRVGVHVYNNNTMVMKYIQLYIQYIYIYIYNNNMTYNTIIYNVISIVPLNYCWKQVVAHGDITGDASEFGVGTCSIAITYVITTPRM